MKSVVVPVQPYTLSVANVNPDRYYGVARRECSRAFVLKEASHFYLMHISAVMSGSRDYSSSLCDLLTPYVNAGDTVVEFTTHQELFRWLAEK